MCCAVLAIVVVGPPVKTALTRSADPFRAETELTSKDVAFKESSLADVAADAIRAEGKSDAAFVAASSFNETTIAKGPFTLSDMLNGVVYDGDDVVVVKLTGDQTLKALEHGLYLYPKPNSGFLQTSGLSVTVNPDGASERHVISARIAGDTIDPSRVYRVAMPAPLANGALAYFKVWKKSDIERDTGKTVEQAVTDYLNEHKVISKGDERLVVKGK